MSNKIRVTFFQRKPYTGKFSVEYIFEDVRKRLPSDFAISVLFSKYTSRGIFRRVYNIFQAN